MTGLLQRMRRRVLQPVSFPQYAAVGLPDPQERVDVRLTGHGDPRDVTHNNVVVSLRPLTIGVMFDGDDRGPGPHDDAGLEFRVKGGNDLLGVVTLRSAGEVDLGSHVFRLFEPTSSSHLCVPLWARGLYYEYERLKTARIQRRNPHNFQMTHEDLRALFVFYICPRPVVLVSVEHEGQSNLFPMDLIGPTDSRWFSMALRLTSPAVSLMRGSRRMALASVPLSYKTAAYDLGKHHRQATVDWNAIPFATIPSPAFGLRTPGAALRVREVSVEEVREVGSHALFLTSVVRDTVPAAASDRTAGLQLFHVHGACHRYFAKHGVSLPEAEPV